MGMQNLTTFLTLFIRGQGRTIGAAAVALLVSACGAPPPTAPSVAGAQTATASPATKTGSKAEATLSEGRRWGLELGVKLDEAGKPENGRFEFRNLRCSGSYNFKGFSEAGEFVLQQRLERGTCVQGCELVIKPDWSGYRETCNGRTTGSGTLTGGEQLARGVPPARQGRTGESAAVATPAATGPGAASNVDRAGFLLSPYLGDPLPPAAGRYTQAMLTGFDQKLHPNASAVDFDRAMSVIASCSFGGSSATVYLDGQRLNIDSPQPGTRKQPCHSVALSPNRSFLAVTYGTPNYSIAYSTAVFALSKEGTGVKAQLIQWAPGASTVDFSDDSRRALFGSQYNYLSGGPGNYLRATDLVEGKEIFHRFIQDPLKSYRHNTPDVRIAVFTPHEQGAVALLNQHSGIDYRWFDLHAETGRLTGARPYSTKKNSYRAAVSMDRSTVVSTAEGGRFNVYSLKDGDGPKALGAFIMPPGGLSFGDRSAQGIAISTSGRIVAVCRDTETAARLTLWSFASGKTTGEREYPGVQCGRMNDRTFRFSPDDRHILIAARAGGLQWLPTPGILDADFDRVAGIVDSGDMAAIKRAFDAAKSPDAKKLIETLLLKKHADRLVSITHTTRGIGAKAFGGSGTGLGAELLTLIAGYKVGAEAQAQVDYRLRIDPKVLKVDNVYSFTADAVLVATGEGYYETNCMWPLPTVCKNPMKSQEFRARISGTLDRNNPTSGSVVINWVPKFESRTGGGLGRFFVASDVNVRIDKLNIEAKE